MAPRSSEPKYFCTASNCKKRINSSFEAFLHPLLKCLICRKCHTEYKTGDFSLFEDGVDDNGDDNYCRWCVDGGDLFTCGNADAPSTAIKCHYSFCTDCIKHNCPDDDVLRSEQFEKDWKWNCYACDPSKLEKHRKAAQEAIIYLGQKDLKRNATGNAASDKATPAKDTEVSSTKTVNSDPDEHGSATKKRKTDKDVASSQTNEASKEQEREKNKEKDRGKDRVREKEREKEKEKEREKEKEKEREKEKEKEKDKEKEREKDKDKDKDKDSFREPESVNRPPMEPVRPVTSTLRNLKNPSSSIPKPQASPNSAQQQQQSVFLTTDKNLTKAQPNSTTKQPSNSATKQPPNSTTKQPSTSQASNNNDLKLKSSLAANNLNNSNETSKSKPIVSAVHLHPRAGLSKQLKSSTETITPSTRIHLSDHDLRTRLDAFGKIKDRCLKEIGVKFETIFEMFTNKELENKAILKSEIEDLDHAVEDFKRMITSLKSLQSSQRI